MTTGLEKTGAAQLVGTLGDVTRKATPELSKAYQEAGVHPSRVDEYHQAVMTYKGDPARSIPATEAPKASDFAQPKAQP